MEVAFQPVDYLPPVSGQSVYANVGYEVYSGEKGFLRRYIEHKEGDRPYAVSSMDWEHGRGQVWYLSGDAAFFTESRNSFFHIAFEEWLMHFGRLVLHASFVASPFGGLLFSGPSGVGKSTQASLWETYEGCQVINGDKPILLKEGDTWCANGSPYAGSSRRYVPRTENIAGIFLLEQGASCRIRRLGSAEAFRGLFAGTTMNLWNDQYMASACDLLMDLATRVPVYRLTCTPDRNAVEIVKEALVTR